MSNIVKMLRSFNDLVSLKPASNIEISNAEIQLAVKFADEYKEYLSEFGAASANGHELTGIIVSERLNVVSVTNREWELNPQVPHTMYVVENTGIDGIVIWQDSHGAVYRSEPNKLPVKMGHSISSLLGHEVL